MSDCLFCKIHLCCSVRISKVHLSVRVCLSVCLQYELEKQQPGEQTAEQEVEVSRKSEDQEKKSKPKFLHNTGTNKQVGENIPSRGSEQRHRHVVPAQLPDYLLCFGICSSVCELSLAVNAPHTHKHRCRRCLGQRRASWSSSGKELGGCSRWTRTRRRSGWLLT